MKIKSLLLGSAAALVAVSGARAADAVIIPEPEMVEYVRVCDAAGAGYFYIPGSETCLEISGWARFQINHTTSNGNAPSLFFFQDADTGSAWALTPDGVGSVSFASTGQFNISSWTDSEIGPIETYLEFETPGGGGVDLDVVSLSFAGLTMGYFGGFLDNGINGETDNNGLENKFNSIQYSGTAGAISFGASIDQLGSNVWLEGADATFGVEGMIGYTSGAIGATLVGFYDLGADAGGFVGRVSADIGMGTLQFRGTWHENALSGYAPLTTLSPDFGGAAMNYVLEASYAAQINDKLTLTPGFSYVSWYEGIDGGKDRMWTAGLTADYKIAANLALKANVEYWDFRDGQQTPAAPGGVTNGNGWRNFLRFQASF
jgi:hypothetical protein